MAGAQARQEDAALLPLDERSKYLRRLVVRTLQGGERGHVGSSMSLVEIIAYCTTTFCAFVPTNRNGDGATA
jgi:transketolase N-terminal domain/subunit